MPTVRGVTFAAASTGSIVYQRSASTKTGVASAKQIASTVGNAVCDGTSTSSPGLTPSARNTIQSAAVPEFVRTAWWTPTYAASSVSNAFDCGPRMYWRESMAAITAFLISASTGGRESGIDVTRDLLP